MSGSRRYYPRRSLLWALGGLTLLALFGVFFDWVPGLWLFAVSLLTLLVLIDLRALARRAEPLVEREVDPNLPLGARQQVRLKVHNPGRAFLRLRLHDHYPQDFLVEGMPAQLSIDAGEAAVVSYRVKARVRGDHSFTASDLVEGSALGFWSRVLHIENRQQVRVFPNFGEVSHFVLLAGRNRLSAAGVRRRQRRGQGSEFHQLREYQDGDSLRQVDWKATARYRKLIAREYQDEQNQQLFFLLDCGQRMRHIEGDYEHLDMALNAMLLAAHVAVKQGDAVGFMTFAGSERFVAPKKGADAVPALLRAIYDIQSSTRAADFLRAADLFMARQMRRALVILVTNTRDGDLGDLLLAVRLLQKRHLVLVADLRESVLDDCIVQPVERREQALNFMTAQALCEARARSHELMRHQGAVVIDLLPQQLPQALVNEYFEIKRTARL